MSNKKFARFLALLTVSSFTTACADGLIITPTYDGGLMIRTQTKSPPRIHSLEYTPKTTANKNDVMTFSVEAVSKTSEPLQYSWKSSKGTLLSNSGNTVSWKPVRADGSLETGIATITVTVSDGVNTVDASANVFIGNNGSVRSDDNEYYEEDDNEYYEEDDNEYYEEDDDYGYYNYNHSRQTTTYYTPRPTVTSYSSGKSCGCGGTPKTYYSPKPYYTPKPTYTPTPTSFPNPTSTPNNQKKIYFFEDFEQGFLEDEWNITYQDPKTSQYLTWKKLTDDTNNKNNVSALTGPTDSVLSETTSSEVQITSQAIDLRNAKLPRLSLDVKSYANPVTAVKLNIYWSHQGKAPRSMNVSFIPDKNWNKIDIDLNNVLSEQGSSIGLLTIGASINGNKNEFKGPMIDNIMIYEN